MVELRQRLKGFKMPQVVPIIITYVLLCIAIVLASPNFLSLRNIMNIGQFSAIMGVAATGMTIVIISGGLDISIGAIMGLTCMFIAKTAPESGNVALVILSGIGMGVACGAINGLAITRAKINRKMRFFYSLEKKR